jgi:hypothetical protein
MRMDTGEIQQRVLGQGSSSLLVCGRFQKDQCLHQQGAVQSWQGTDLATGEAVVVKTAPLHALQVGALERMMRDDAVLRDLRSPWLAPPLDCSGLVRSACRL